eukprot:6464267-Amphidinium_carterae.1
MPIRETSARSPGPGPITSELWSDITRSSFNKGYPMVLHTDSARAYSRPIPDVYHTSVVHQLKRINGVWTQPVFAQKNESPWRTVMCWTVLDIKTGTQTIDGYWTYLRACITGGVRDDNASLDAMVRFSQFVYWNQGTDPFRSLAVTMGNL